MAFGSMSIIMQQEKGIGRGLKLKFQEGPLVKWVLLVGEDSAGRKLRELQRHGNEQKCGPQIILLRLQNGKLSLIPEKFSKR